MKILVPLLALGLLAAGCASLDTQKQADYSQVRRIYVEHRLTDNHHLDELIVAELNARGYTATCGPLTMMPEGMDAILTYEDRWAWDFHSYVMELGVELRASITDKPLASAHYHQAAATTKSTEAVVREVIDALFKRR
jgi:hypothetical protein